MLTQTHSNPAREKADEEALILGLWPVVVGERVATRTRAVGLFGATLVVETAAQDWRRQLARMTGTIVDKLNAGAGKTVVQDIEFRLAVKIADFKSRLSEHLRLVRRGHEVVIKDRETPIARVIPYQTKTEELIVRPPTRPLRDLRRLPGVKAKKLKPGDLDRALRATKSDWLDQWLSERHT